MRKKIEVVRIWILWGIIAKAQPISIFGLVERDIPNSTRKLRILKRKLNFKPIVFYLIYRIKIYKFRASLCLLPFLHLSYFNFSKFEWTTGEGTVIFRIWKNLVEQPRNISKCTKSEDPKFTLDHKEEDKYIKTLFQMNMHYQ